jgi:hypothetical protein
MTDARRLLALAFAVQVSIELLVDLLPDTLVIEAPAGWLAFALLLWLLWLLSGRPRPPRRKPARRRVAPYRLASTISRSLSKPTPRL